MFTYVIFSLVLAILAGVLTVTSDSPVPTIVFGVSLVLFLAAGFAYMRERYRGSR